VVTNCFHPTEQLIQDNVDFKVLKYSFDSVPFRYTPTTAMTGFPGTAVITPFWTPFPP
jgi:hypothetical protein